MGADYDALIPTSPPRDSLLTLSHKMVNGTDGAGDRWTRGFSFRPEVCKGGGMHWTCVGDGGSAADPKEIPADQNPTVIDYFPGTAWVGERCTPDPGGDNSWFKSYATRQLDGCLSSILENELWDGGYAVLAAQPNRYLAQSGAVVTPESTTALGVVTAVAELEQALADCSCGGVHMIHAQPRTITHMENHQLVHRDKTDRLVTANGSLVVRGTGYSGSGPSDITAGRADVSWIYGTSMISTFVGPVRFVPNDIDEALDRATNLVEYRAEREVAAVWDGCCHVGVKVDHNATRTSTGS